MVTHLVLLTPRADLSATDRARFASAFERAVREIPTVRGVRVGRRLTHGAGYEAAVRPFQFLAIVEFDDLAGLQAYLQHPAHGALGERFAADVSAAAVYDFEMAPLEELLTPPPRP